IAIRDRNNLALEILGGPDYGGNSQDRDAKVAHYALVNGPARFSNSSRWPSIWMFSVLMDSILRPCFWPRWRGSRGERRDQTEGGRITSLRSLPSVGGLATHSVS